MRDYKVMLADKPVGSVHLESKGLYYRLSCRCTPPRPGAWHLAAEHGTEQIDLGLCVPKNGHWGMDIMIPVKRLGPQPQGFALLEKAEEEFVPVDPNKPFDQLWRLPYARFSKRNGAIGLLFSQPGPARPDNDPSL